MITSLRIQLKIQEEIRLEQVQVPIDLKIAVITEDNWTIWKGKAYQNRLGYAWQMINLSVSFYQGFTKEEYYMLIWLASPHHNVVNVKSFLLEGNIVV